MPRLCFCRRLAQKAHDSRKELPIETAENMALLSQFRVIQQLLMTQPNPMRRFPTFAAILPETA